MHQYVNVRSALGFKNNDEAQRTGSAEPQPIAGALQEIDKEGASRRANPALVKMDCAEPIGPSSDRKKMQSRIESPFVS
jgi:hypothetical protein